MLKNKIALSVQLLLTVVAVLMVVDCDSNNSNNGIRSIVLRDRLNDPGLVTTVVFSGDGRYLLSTSIPVPDKADVVRVWDLSKIAVATPTPLKVPPDRIYTVAASHKGRTVASGSQDGIIGLWDVSQPQATPTVLNKLNNTPVTNGSEINSLAFSPDDQMLLAGYDNGAIYLWSLQQGEHTSNPLILSESSGHRVSSVAFSHDGKLAAADTLDNSITVWRVGQPQLSPIELHGHELSVTSLAFSPKDQILASASDDGTVRLWNLQQPTASPTVLSVRPKGVGVNDVNSIKYSINAVAFSPNGLMLATGSLDKTVRLWNLQQPTASPIRLTGHYGPINSVAFSPSGQILASGSDDGTIRLWQIANIYSISTPIANQWC